MLSPPVGRGNQLGFCRALHRRGRDHGAAVARLRLRRPTPADRLWPKQLSRRAGAVRQVLGGWPMKAIIFEQPGDPRQVLQLRDVPPPAPPPGHVLVRMIASPINPSDLIFITGMYGVKPVLPATPGFEGVGVVERSGGGLLGWLRRG